MVGGYAVALHGAVRGTVDVDIAIALDQKSIVKAQQTLESLELASRLPLNAAEVYEFREEYIAKRNFKSWSFVDLENPARCVDLLITEDAKKIDIVELSFGETTIPVASIDDLIRMKSKAKRPQDLSDIEALKKIKAGQK